MMHLKFALGVLLWTPETFWKSTMADLMIAYYGYSKANNVEEKRGMTKSEFSSLKAKLAETKE